MRGTHEMTDVKTEQPTVSTRAMVRITINPQHSWEKVVSSPHLPVERLRLHHVEMGPRPSREEIELQEGESNSYPVWNACPPTQLLSQPFLHSWGVPQAAVHAYYFT